MGCSSSSEGVAAATAPSTFFERYQLSHKIGQGSCAEIYEAHPSAGTSASSGIFGKCAVKVVDMARASSTTQGRIRQRQYSSEVIAWEHIGTHPNVVALCEHFEDRNRGYLVMEMCMGNLQAMLQSFPFDCDQFATRTCLDMLAAVAHLHASHVVHCDVKPTNFLMGADGHTVKLCDFGLAHVLAENRHELLKGLAGTAAFMSPEMLDRQGFDTRTDIWSLGATIYSLLYGYAPYGSELEDPEGVKASIISGSPAPKYCQARECFTCRFDPPSHLEAFVRMLLTRDPYQRPSGSTAMGILNNAIPNKRDRGITPSKHQRMIGQNKSMAMEASAFSSRNSQQQVFQNGDFAPSEVTTQEGSYSSVAMSDGWSSGDHCSIAGADMRDYYFRNEGYHREVPRMIPGSAYC